MFSPQLNNEPLDKVAGTLAKISQTILLVTLGLVPILFLPISYAPFAYSKVMIVIAGIALSLIFFALSALRSGALVVKMHTSLLALWGVAMAAVISAALSGDTADAFLGSVFSIHTAAFLLVVALTASVITIIGESKSAIMRLYLCIAGSGLVVGLYQLLRVVFGEELLSFGVFTSITNTPMGSWNDVALFFGLVILLIMLTLEQLPLSRVGRSVMAVATVLSMIILAMVNFSTIWIILGLASLVVLMYALTKNQFNQFADTARASNTLLSIILSAFVFIMSATFIVGGGALGQVVNETTGVSYVEVRPSLSATTDIAREVYKENAITGIGANKFADAWRLHKDPSINVTAFWNASFSAGVGYVPTFAVTLGLLGVIAWLVFFVLLIYTGFRFIFRSNQTDTFWQYVGTSSFVAALYLWGMSIMYVPGMALILLASAFTGLLAVAYSQVSRVPSFQLSIAQNKQAGFVMVAATVVVIVSSVAIFFFVGRHYGGVYTFNKTLSTVEEGMAVETIERQIADAFALTTNDAFAREIVGIQLNKIRSLVNIPERTDIQQQQLDDALVTAVNGAQLAAQTDPTEPQNWMMLGNVFSILASSGVEGAFERANEAFKEAEKFDPTNPEIQLLRAQLEGAAGNLDTAKDLAIASVSLKQNYSPALLFITQLDIARGDVDGAIAATQASISLEPRNPARHYQLGVLYSSQDNLERAVQSFETAVALDASYANARYFLALAYIQANRTDDAIAQLEVVAELNPDNQQVIALIDALQSGNPVVDSTDLPEQVADEEAEVNEDGDVTTTEDPDSPLLTPVNVVPEDSDSEAEEESEEAETVSETAE